MDGKMLAHTKTTFNVNVPVLPPDYRVTWLVPEKPVEFNVEHHHYRYVLGQWIWQKKPYG